MSYDKNIILEELRSLDFIWLGSEIRRFWFGKLLGWNVAASSVMRKSYTLKRLQETIDEKNLPLEIKDWPEYTNAFQVLLKDAA